MEAIKETACPDCIEEGGLCQVCWAFENTPEVFALTAEQMETMERGANYVRKHKITPNLDSPY